MQIGILPWQSKNSSSLPDSDSLTILSIRQFTICMSKLLFEIGECIAALVFQPFLAPPVSSAGTFLKRMRSSQARYWRSSTQADRFLILLPLLPKLGYFGRRVFGAGFALGADSRARHTYVGRLPETRWALRVLVLLDASKSGG